MAQFANYAQGVIHGNNEVYILFLTVFSVGIAIGSLACDTLLKGEISLKMLPIAALGVSVFTALMVITTPPPMHEGWLDVWQFLQAPQRWSVLGSMLMVAVCGGLYIVPLYAMLQSHTPTPYRSRVMAASNLSDALCMTTAALVSATHPRRRPARRTARSGQTTARVRSDRRTTNQDVHAACPPD